MEIIRCLSESLMLPEPGRLRIMLLNAVQSAQRTGSAPTLVNYHKSQSTDCKKAAFNLTVWSMAEQFQQMDLAGKHQLTKINGFLKFETFLPDCDDILMFFYLLVHIQDKMSKGVGKVDNYFILLISKWKDPCAQQTQAISVWIFYFDCVYIFCESATLLYLQDYNTQKQF